MLSCIPTTSHLETASLAGVGTQLGYHSAEASKIPMMHFDPIFCLPRINGAKILIGGSGGPVVKMGIITWGIIAVALKLPNDPS